MYNFQSNSSFIQFVFYVKINIATEAIYLRFKKNDHILFEKQIQ